MDCKKISLDFHGVIYESPDFFRSFAEYAMKSGIKIYVVSGGPRAYIENFLKEKHIPYDVLWFIIDVPQINGKTQFFSDGSFRVTDELWDKAKGDYCREEKINIHIDDSKVYGKYFTKGYCRYEANSCCFYLDKCVLKAKIFTKDFFDELLCCAEL